MIVENLIQPGMRVKRIRWKCAVKDVQDKFHPPIERLLYETFWRRGIRTDTGPGEDITVITYPKRRI